MICPVIGVMTSPSTKHTRSVRRAGTRGPGEMIPVRLSGSQPLISTRIPVRAAFRVRVSMSAASGVAYCSPPKPDTKRPPRIVPRASRRRNAQRISRHGSASDSVATRAWKTTPQRARSCSATASANSSACAVGVRSPRTVQRPSPPLRTAVPRRSPRRRGVWPLSRASNSERSAWKLSAWM